MKWCGILLLLLTGLGVGNSRATALQSRVRETQRCGQLLYRIAEQLRQESTPLMPLFRGITGDGVLAMALRTQAAADPRTLWKKAVGSCATVLGPDSEPFAVLMELSEQWGHGDLEAEIHRTAAAAQRIDGYADVWSKTAHERANLYRLLGGCAGMLSALLLL